MTQEEKELVLKDITARSYYELKVQIDFGEHCIKYGIDRYVDDTVICVWPETFEVGVNDEDQACDIEDVKPYLRPMSSMTEEEYEEFCKTDNLMATLLEINRLGIQGTPECHIMIAKALGARVAEQQNWLNSHHFDYRGLIPKGLALEAPEGMYKS